MPKIALAEPYDHGEVLYVLCELLLGQQDIELYIFTQKYIHDHAPEPVKNGAGIYWFTFRPGERETFFRNKLNVLNGYSLVIWITAIPPYNWISELQLKPPLILIIHNRNNWFAPLQNLSIAISTPLGFVRDIARLFRWLFSLIRQQRILLKKTVAIGYASRRLLINAHKEGHLPPSAEALVIPFTYLKHPPPMVQAPSSTVKIVIPGTVTDNGRDYYSVARALAVALPRSKRRVELVLLGRVGPVKGVDELRQLENERFRLTTFSDWVPYKEYMKHLMEADFLILPFLAWHKVGIVKEYWGESGFSGAVSDMVYYGLPALCSSFHPLDDGLEEWVERYSGREELAALLLQWINEQSFLALKEKIRNYHGSLQKEKAGSLLMHELYPFIHGGNSDEKEE